MDCLVFPATILKELLKGTARRGKRAIDVSTTALEPWTGDFALAEISKHNLRSPMGHYLWNKTAYSTHSASAFEKTSRATVLVESAGPQRIGARPRVSRFSWSNSPEELS